MNFSIIVLLLTSAAASALALITPTSQTAGIAACADLVKSLGAAKVVSGLNPSYIVSTSYYYSQQQAANKPACVVVPTQNTDVQTAMKAIRSRNSTMAIKAGGHNTNNYWSSTPGGVLIDFKSMKGKSYDAANQRGTYQPGNVYQDLYDYYAQYKVTVVGARIGGVGSGLAIGGGLSFLSAEYGFACDSFYSLDVVLADGRIVTATKSNENSELLFSIKGGGNQFGIVVSYTVDVHPQDYQAYGGLLVYDASQTEAVFSQILKFTNENKDTKAAVIGTLDILGTPGVGDDFLKALNLPLDLDTFILVFNVYDGPNPGTVFAPFEAIPHIADTRKTQSYSDVESMVDIGHLSSGAVSYRAGSHHSNTAQAQSTLLSAIQNFRNFASSAKGLYDLVSFDMQPIPASLVQQSNQRGYNAQLSVPGPYYFINYLCSSLSTDPSACAGKLKTAVDLTPSDSDLPIFLNDANADQPILQSYNGYSRLQKAKKFYDPTNFLQTNMGGPRF